MFTIIAVYSYNDIAVFGDNGRIFRTLTERVILTVILWYKIYLAK